MVTTNPEKITNVPEHEELEPPCTVDEDCKNSELIVGKAVGFLRQWKIELSCDQQFYLWVYFPKNSSGIMHMYVPRRVYSSHI